jgi:gas vesicle protein
MPHNWHSSVSHTCVEAPYSEVMESTRPTWNDQRMDEFVERTEQNFREVRNDIRATRTELRTDLRGEIHGVKTELREEIHGVKTELREEIKAVKTELKGDIQELRVEMNGRFAGIERRFDILFGALATGFVGALVTHFLG